MLQVAKNHFRGPEDFLDDAFLIVESDADPFALTRKLRLVISVKPVYVVKFVRIISDKTNNPEVQCGKMEFYERLLDSKVIKEILTLMERLR